MLGFIIYLLVIGVFAGFLARFLVPGPDPMGIAGTIVLGIVGSFIGGFLGWAIFGEDFDDGAVQASGVIGSIIGAVIALLIWRAVNRGGAGRTGTGTRSRMRTRL
ncbi:MAG: GlsB/YeaQ/YmgE family stress response membrane protein [Acidimicrobiales bacterium]|nr:GlsB/YeaQ/YmgE family stress response membrane protein [Acidimicrobiales bacterium]